MPATSKAQQRAAAIALHHPEALHAHNRGLAGLSMKVLHEFADTPRKGLPARVKGGERTMRELHQR